MRKITIAEKIASIIKLFVLPILFLLAIILLGIFEQYTITKEFGEFMEETEIMQQRVFDEEDCMQQIKDMEIKWQKSKQKMHIYIPHNDIVDVEIMIGEVKGLVEIDDKENAYVKLVALYAKFHQIPERYQPKIGNIL